MQKNDEQQEFKLSDLLRFRWNPKPLHRPRVHRSLLKLDPITRSAESLRYSVMSAEFWISPDGQVREWLRNNGRLAVVIAIPAFLILPVITFGLWQVASWMAALIAISSKLIIFPILVLMVAVVIKVIIAIIRAELRRK